MTRFIQLHLLTSYPPANLNRDDLGRPKTAKMGGVDRLRISSQSLKRAWRTSELFHEALTGHMGTRTKIMGVKVYQWLLEKGISHNKAVSISKEIAAEFGKLKTLSKKDKEKLIKAEKEGTITKAERQKKELVELEIEQLAHFCQSEEDAIWNLVERCAESGKAPDKDELALLKSDIIAVDIALFGRMLASKPAFNVEAACQVAHAVSVHPVVIEDDYFTAVDDLNDNREDAGAAHIGETGFAAGLFYLYVCLNRELLEQNLGGDSDLADRAVKAFTESVIKVPPTGKQNSFASRAYANFVLAEKGHQQPRSLSVAFLKPITDRESEDFGAAAVDTLMRQQQNMDKVYGACADTRYTIDSFRGEGSFSELMDFIVE